MRPAADQWTVADIPDQDGRTALVTGTSVGGLGLHTALELARRGARVVLAGRREDRLAETRAAILAEVRNATLEQLVVDLSDLDNGQAIVGPGFFRANWSADGKALYANGPGGPSRAVRLPSASARPTRFSK